MSTVVLLCIAMPVHVRRNGLCLAPQSCPAKDVGVAVLFPDDNQTCLIGVCAAGEARAGPSQPEHPGSSMTAAHGQAGSARKSGRRPLPASFSRATAAAAAAGKEGALDAAPSDAHGKGIAQAAPAAEERVLFEEPEPAAEAEAAQEVGSAAAAAVPQEQAGGASAMAAVLDEQPALVADSIDLVSYAPVTAPGAQQAAAPAAAREPVAPEKAEQAQAPAATTAAEPAGAAPEPAQKPAAKWRGRAGGKPAPAAKDKPAPAAGEAHEQQRQPGAGRGKRKAAAEPEEQPVDASVATGAGQGRGRDARTCCSREARVAAGRRCSMAAWRRASGRLPLPLMCASVCAGGSHNQDSLVPLAIRLQEHSLQSSAQPHLTAA